MSKFDKSAYDRQYYNDHYTSCKVILKPKEAAILTEFSQNMNVSKSALIQKCLVYCYENMIDVSNVKLSTPDKSGKNKD